MTRSWRTVPRSAGDRLDRFEPRIMRALTELGTATADEVAASARLPEKVARTVLLEMRRAGLVERLVLPETCLYSPVREGRQS